MRNTYKKAQAFAILASFLIGNYLHAHIHFQTRKARSLWANITPCKADMAIALILKNESGYGELKRLWASASLCEPKLNGDRGKVQEHKRQLINELMTSLSTVQSRNGKDSVKLLKTALKSRNFQRAIALKVELAYLSYRNGKIKTYSKSISPDSLATSAKQSVDDKGEAIEERELLSVDREAVLEKNEQGDNVAVLADTLIYNVTEKIGVLTRVATELVGDPAYGTNSHSGHDVPLRFEAGISADLGNDWSLECVGIHIINREGKPEHEVKLQVEKEIGEDTKIAFEVGHQFGAEPEWHVFLIFRYNFKVKPAH